jgi:hypothetical protein
MSGSKIVETLEFDSREGAIHFARHVIQMMPCEWEGCPIILNSWVTLAKVINPGDNSSSLFITD